MKISFRTIVLVTIVFLPLYLMAQNGLSVHGHLSQAFAISKDHPILGINDKGTFDYRNLALQFRYDADPQNIFIVQLNHRRTGVSPISAFQNDVELDWAYFEHHFDNSLSFKVGKIQMPFGIYNELRDMGVLLPFYHLPFAPYGEGNYNSETIDGASLLYNFSWGEWEIQNHLYAGQFSFVEWLTIKNPLSGQKLTVTGVADVDNTLGLKIWFLTPIDGFSFGFSGYHADISNGVSFNKEAIGENQVNAFLASVDFTKDSYYLRSEYSLFTLVENGVHIHSIYGQLGYSINEFLQINIQSTFIQAREIDAPSFPDIKTEDYLIDHALGLKYALTDNIILKAEHHINDSFIIEDEINRVPGPSYKSSYSIISLSSSF